MSDHWNQIADELGTPKRPITSTPSTEASDTEPASYENDGTLEDQTEATTPEARETSYQETRSEEVIGNEPEDFVQDVASETSADSDHAFSSQQSENIEVEDGDSILKTSWDSLSRFLGIGGATEARQKPVTPTSQPVETSAPTAPAEANSKSSRVRTERTTRKNRPSMWGDDEDSPEAENSRRKETGEHAAESIGSEGSVDLEPPTATGFNAPARPRRTREPAESGRGMRPRGPVENEFTDDSEAVEHDSAEESETGKEQNRRGGKRRKKNRQLPRMWESEDDADDNLNSNDTHARDDRASETVDTEAEIGWGNDDDEDEPSFGRNLRNRSEGFSRDSEEEGDGEPVRRGRRRRSRRSEANSGNSDRSHAEGSDAELNDIGFRSFDEDSDSDHPRRSRRGRSREQRSDERGHRNRDGSTIRDSEGRGSSRASTEDFEDHGASERSSESRGTRRRGRGRDSQAASPRRGRDGHARSAGRDDTGRETRGERDFGDEESTERTNKRARNAKIPTWLDAITPIVDSNLENHSKSQSSGRRRRR